MESRMRCTSGVSVSANSRPPTLAMHARESPCVRGCQRVRGPHIRVEAWSAYQSQARPARVGDARQGEPVRVRMSTVGPPTLAMHARESPRACAGVGVRV